MSRPTKLKRQTKAGLAPISLESRAPRGFQHKQTTLKGENGNMEIAYLKKAALVCGLVLAAWAITPAVQAENKGGQNDGCCCSGNSCCCGNSCGASASNQATPATSGRASGINRADLDTSVDLHQDFYHYAIGGWQKANPIPSDQARWGTFTILADNNTKLLHEILEDAAKSPKSSLEEKLGTFYKSGLDEKAIEAAGVTPLKDDLEPINSITDLKTLQKVLVECHNLGLNPYFSLDSAQDDKDSTRQIATIWQSGLGLPERDYYTRQDERSKELRSQYVKFVENLFKLSGFSAQKAKAAAQHVMDIETRLAKASLPAAETRDPQKMYHLMHQEGLTKLTPSLDWSTYYKGIGIAQPKDINVTVPEFMQAVNVLLSDRSLLEAHKDYLRWNLIRSAAPYLSKDLEQCHFDFYSKTLRGTKVMKPRWKRVTDVVSSLVDQGMGQLYVQRAFPPESKKRVQDMVENIKAYMAEDIPRLDWMSETTKKAALEKLSLLKAKIGYPDVPRDYSKLEIGTSYYDNMRNAMRFEKRRSLGKIGQPVDPNDWYMPAHMVNAYYAPSDNEIVFPAGILQPPFFDPRSDDAANYGGIGTVIGHEISHGFDDQGAQYDGHGNLRNWWTKEDKVKFDKLTKGVEDQFSSYTVQGQHLNGKLVLGESIADLSGLALSFGAYQHSLNGGAGEVIDGFTPAQRFFLNYAKVWAINISPEMEKLQINTDPHPTANWRVNGPLSNNTDFFKAFDIKEGDAMCRPVDKRNKIW